MTQVLLPPLMLYAACGLVLSLVVHILSFFGVQFGGNTLFFGLHVGIFPLWIPVVFIAQKMMGGTQREDFWKVALSGCPAWMRYMTYGFFIYAFVNFAISIILVSMHPPRKGRRGASAGGAARLLRPLDGVLLGGLGDLTTAYRRGLLNLQRKCPFGHEIGWSDRFCPTCGSSVAPAQDQI